MKDQWQENKDYFMECKKKRDLRNLERVEATRKLAKEVLGNCKFLEESIRLSMSKTDFTDDEIIDGEFSIDHLYWRNVLDLGHKIKKITGLHDPYGRTY